MKYRKKPVVIEAKQFTGMETDTFVFNGESVTKTFLVMVNPEKQKCLEIHTLEGTHRADPGDWIIRDVKGEFYPCKPDIFAATYEPA